MFASQQWLIKEKKNGQTVLQAVLQSQTQHNSSPQNPVMDVEATRVGVNGAAREKGDVLSGGMDGDAHAVVLMDVEGVEPGAMQY